MPITITGFIYFYKSFCRALVVLLNAKPMWHIISIHILDRNDAWNRFIEYRFPFNHLCFLGLVWIEFGTSARKPFSHNNLD